MSRAYYYFAASLPLIDWDAKPPMTVDAFLSDCRRLLADQDYQLVKDVVEGGGSALKTGQPQADAWLRFDRNFRSEMVLIRAQRLNKDPAKYLPGLKAADPAARALFHQAAQLPNLMSAQKLIDRAVWRFLDDLSAGHFYDIVVIFIYGLKLRILARHWEYRSPNGKSLLEDARKMEFPESCLLETDSQHRRTA